MKKVITLVVALAALVITTGETHAGLGFSLSFDAPIHVRHREYRGDYGRHYERSYARPVTYYQPVRRYYRPRRVVYYDAPVYYSSPRYSRRHCDY